MLDVLVTAVMRLIHAALGPMVDRPHRRQLNVSERGRVPAPRVAYSAAKACVTTLGTWAAAEYAQAGRADRDHPLPRLHAHRVPRPDGGRGETSAPDFLWLDADDLVRTALAEPLATVQVYSVPSARYKLITGAARVVPRGVLQRFQSLGRK